MSCSLRSDQFLTSCKGGGPFLIRCCPGTLLSTQCDTVYIWSEVILRIANFRSEWQTLTVAKNKPHRKLHLTSLILLMTEEKLASFPCYLLSWIKNHCTAEPNNFFKNICFDFEQTLKLELCPCRMVLSIPGQGEFKLSICLCYIDNILSKYGSCHLREGNTNVHPEVTTFQTSASNWKKCLAL